jgi:dihydroorotate dehydrogenase electron transfer subunit
MTYNLVMRAFSVTLIANNEILPGTHLLEVQAPALARAAQPGQYCMLRGCDSLANDPLLRRPFFVAAVGPERDVCQFLVHKRGRVSTWLTRQQPGMSLDLLGPLGRGWTSRSETRNLLLIGEDPLLASLLLLAANAVEQEFSVTLLHLVSSAEQGFPAALLPPEIEYQVFVGANDPEMLAAQTGAYMAWADSVCCSVSENTLATLVGTGVRWREKHFAQAIIDRPLMCVTGTCQACRVETRHGPRQVCREGPVFALRDLMAIGSSY